MQLDLQQFKPILINSACPPSLDCLGSFRPRPLLRSCHAPRAGPRSKTDLHIIA